MIPWYIKIAAKVVLSRLPLKYGFWQRLGLFRAGAMDDPSYAYQVFMMHLEAAGLKGRQGHTILEMGPGDSVLTAFFARAYGAAGCVLVDSHDNATRNMAVLQKAARYLTDMGHFAPDLSGVTSVPQTLERLNARYLTGGLASLRSLPDASIDLFFSHAVIEHVRHGELVETLREMRRVLKKGGIASHWIDFRDHLQNGLNNLRFSHNLWESPFMVKSGFYTNRVPWPQMADMIRASGFTIQTLDQVSWPDGLPTSQRSMSAPYRGMPEGHLQTMTNWVLLRADDV